MAKKHRGNIFTTAVCLAMNRHQSTATFLTAGNCSALYKNTYAGGQYSSVVKR